MVSIKIKIALMVSIFLLMTAMLSIFITIQSESRNLTEATEKHLAANRDMLTRVITNIMLSGEAPIAVATMRSLKEMSSFMNLGIYRTSGDIAFHDYETLDFVNNRLVNNEFDKTERINDNMIDSKYFKEVLRTNRIVQTKLSKKKDLEYFFPIFNYQNCQSCHGTTEETGFIRGVAYFKISLADIYNQINRSAVSISLFFITMTIFLGLIIYVVLQKIIISPMLHIGDIVGKVGNGNFLLNTSIKSNDELGKLGAEINDMITKVKERIHLKKYVSRQTNENLFDLERNKPVRKNTTVLFTDIRNFTGFSDIHDPEEVLNHLNNILEIQAIAVEKHNGDIDKYIGDAVMAQFKNASDAVKCAYEMLNNVYHYNKEKGIDLYIGAGVNTGEVVTGNMGSSNRMEYAVIGDTVNTASRLCGIAKKNMIIISENTYNEVSGFIRVKKIVNQKLKGKKEILTVYAVTGFIKNS